MCVWPKGRVPIFLRTRGRAMSTLEREKPVDMRRCGEADQPLGVVDIGSNSVRLVVYEAAKRSPAPLYNEKVLCGLGRHVATTGHLGAEAMECALRALRRFCVIGEMLGVGAFQVIATAAAREAEDGPDFIARAEAICGQPIRVLTGEEEATLAATGIIASFFAADGLAGDLGGGSLELTHIRSGAIGEGVTLPLGGLRLLDEADGDIERAARIVADHMAMVPWLDACKGRRFYAIGGTWRALAWLHMEKRDYPLRVIHGYHMGADAALSFCEKILKAKHVHDLDGIMEISKPRRPILPYGALVLREIIRRAAPSQVVVSAAGVREGLLYTMLSEEEQARDPLLAFAEDLATLRSRSPEHARELIAWTDALFGAPGPEETAGERRLRHAACLLSDTGWRTHPDYRGEESLNTIAHAALASIDHPGRAFLALTLYYRHTGRVKGGSSTRLKRLLDKPMLKRARILGAAIRAGHMLSVGTPGVILRTRLSYEGKSRLVLTIPEALAVLDGDRLRKRLKALAEELDRTAEIRIAPDASHP